MTRAVWLFLISIALCSVALSAALMLPAAKLSTTVDTRNAADLAFRPHPGAQLPLQTTLVDERGRTVALGEYFAKSPVILVLENLRCKSLCSVVLRNLVVDALAPLPLDPGRDYQLVAISIDSRDKPADAAAARTTYVSLLQRRGGDTGLHFLTGTPAAVREIADAVGFPYQYDSFLDTYIHPAGFAIATADGMISRYVEGVAISPQELVNAVADAEQSRSSGPLARLILLCHVQGVPLGRFTVPVLTAFTLAHIAAGLSLIVIFAAIRRHRHS